MKKLIAFITVILLTGCLFSCKREDEGEKNNNYPDGAIALTKDNLTDYFDIRVTTDLTDDYYTDYAGVHKQTVAEAYVALVPRAEYASVSGFLKYKLNAGIITGYTQDYNDYSIALGEQTLRLDTGIVNESFDLRVTSDKTYHANKSKNNITVLDVTGYVLLGGEQTPNEYESLTDSDYAESDNVRAELMTAIAELEADYNEARSFNYAPMGVYHFKSLYGSGRDKSNLANLGAFFASVDRENGVYKQGQFTYVLRDGALYQQSLNSAGMVVEQLSTQSLDELNAIGPSFTDLYDDGAVYVKTENAFGGYDYYAYTTLYLMQNAVVKEYFSEHLQNYGITTKWNKFLVKYTYSFDGEGGMYYEATVSYRDDRYDVEYVDVTVSRGFKLADVNNATVTPYVAGKDAFALQDSLEDAMALGTGAVVLKKGDTSFYYTTYSDAYEGYVSTTVKNYFPLIIEESGVYSFTPSAQFITIYDVDGRQVYPQENVYYEAGTYYVCANSVLYGKNTVRMSVSSLYFDDFADLETPTPVTGDAYSFLMESTRDRVALSYTPVQSGVYSFGNYKDVSIDVYLATDLSASLHTVYDDEHCIKLTAGTEYVLLLEYRGEGTDVQYSAEISFIGSPSDYEEFTLNTEWQDVFLWWENPQLLRTEISVVGDYYVEFELTAGQRLPGAYFYNLDGSSCKYYRYVDVEGCDEQLRLTTLGEGSYDCRTSLYNDSYFLGRVRLVPYATGVTEKSTAQISADGYITLSTSPLTTMLSSSTFTFTVSESAKLLYTTDSDFFTLYDEGGNRVSTTVYPTYNDTAHGVEAHYSSPLSVGTYTLVCEIDEYSKPGVKEATVRLLPVEE